MGYNLFIQMYDEHRYSCTETNCTVKYYKAINDTHANIPQLPLHYPFRNISA